LGGIDGLTVGDLVTAEQMRALFGCGLHPLAELRQQQLEGPDLTLRDFQNVARLGAPFKIVDNDLRPFRLEVAKRIEALNAAIGWPADASIAAADRARVRTQVAREFFRAEHGREPVDARELTGWVRFAERPGTDPAKRPIREIVGVDPRLNQRWSTRRAHINTRRGELAIQFQQDHGRPPTPVEALHLAQQATLETRTPNTNPAPSPNNAPPGSTKRQQCSADTAPSHR
jgi:hypothetical protein